jgi:hypothetical protein
LLPVPGHRNDLTYLEVKIGSGVRGPDHADSVRPARRSSGCNNLFIDPDRALICGDKDAFDSDLEPDRNRTP